MVTALSEMDWTDYYASLLDLPSGAMTCQNALERARERKWGVRKLSLLERRLVDTPSGPVKKDWTGFYAAALQLGRKTLTYHTALERAKERQWGTKKLNLLKERLVDTPSGPVKKDWTHFYAAALKLEANIVTCHLALKLARERKWGCKKLRLLEERLKSCSPIVKDWTDVLANLPKIKSSDISHRNGIELAKKTESTDVKLEKTKDLQLLREQLAVKKVSAEDIVHIMGKELGGSVKDRCLAIIRIVFPDPDSTFDKESNTALKAYMHKSINVNLYDFIHAFKYGGKVHNFDSVKDLRSYSKKHKLIMPIKLASDANVKILCRELFRN